MSQNAFTNALAQLDKAAKIIKLDAKLHEKLKAPKRVLKAEVEVKMDDGSTQKFAAYRSQYNDARGPFKGGIRYHPNVSEDEVKALSFWMAIKCATVNIPLGGGKGGIIVDPKKLSLAELERLSRGYVQAFYKNFGAAIDVPAPDVYTTPQIMGWMLDEFEKLVGHHEPGMITGKPLSLGGSAGRAYSTAMGGVYVLEAALKKLGKKPSETSIAIQGFGNAGSHMARLLHERGYQIRAVSDSKSGIMVKSGSLNIPKLLNYKEKNRTLVGFLGADVVTNENLLELAVDVLVPAALENQITQDNANKIKAKVVAELANGPTTPEADEILFKNGVVIVPDILTNAGGVSVSYFEQVQNAYNFYWTEAEVLTRLEKLMGDAFNGVWEAKEKYQVDLRTAAFTLAVERIAQAMRDRGE